MKRRVWPLIRVRKNPGGMRSFMVDPGMVNGLRPRKFFRTRVEADTYAEQLRVARKNDGDSAFDLPQKLRLEALEANRQLGGVDATLPEAVQFYLKHAAPRGGKILVRHAIDELLAAKRSAGRRESYIISLHFVLNAFSRHFEDRYVHEISRSEIEEWLDENFANLSTRRNRIRDVSILFAFALKRGYCGSNPLVEIERPVVIPRRPEIFTVDDAAALLAAAQKYPGTELLPFIAIGLFAGLRTSELKKLRWEDVSLEHRNIDISEEIAKTRQQRNVEINETLASWLAQCASPSGPIVPGQFRSNRKALLEFAEVSKWPKNGLRHSFGSYHFARFQDAHATAFQMGHNSTDVLFKHYRNYRIRPADARRYWQLRPDRKFLAFTNVAA